VWRVAKKLQHLTAGRISHAVIGLVAVRNCVLEGSNEIGFDSTARENMKLIRAEIGLVLLTSTAFLIELKRPANSSRMIRALPPLSQEVADGVTCNGYGYGVSLLREPDA